MKNRLALLCPGQGGQHRRMFDLARSHKRAGELLEQWPLEEKLGMPLDAALSDDALLFSNQMAQPLIVASTLAAWEAVKDRIPSPALVAGYSIGEVAAHGVAGALLAQDAIGLAAARASSMTACMQQSPAQALVAISGVDLRSVVAVLQPHAFHIAIENSEDSVIAGGLLESLLEVEKGVLQAGGRIKALPVEIASHTPYMKTAAAAFGKELLQARFAPYRIPVIAGISASPVQNSAQAMSVLSRQISETIRWMDCMDACAEAGITVALELGPGSALSRMLHARHPLIECRSVDDFRTLAGIEKWLESRAD